jgi:hypothetical protein
MYNNFYPIASTILKSLAQISEVDALTAPFSLAQRWASVV